MTTHADETRDAVSAGDSAVVIWRRAQLLDAGFGGQLSEKLARECGVDLHALVDLVERGCPPRLAGRILSPLAGESRRC
jgi:hypothetical protein